MMRLYIFVFECYGDHLDLHVLTPSFPTRRSPDLAAGPGTSTSCRDRAEQRQHELVMCRPAAQPGLLLGLVPGLDTPAAGGQRRLGWIFPGHAACCVAPERERRAMTAWLADSGVG